MLIEGRIKCNQKVADCSTSKRCLQTNSFLQFLVQISREIPQVLDGELREIPRMATTLVLTRKPNALFTYGKLHGRFGTLIVLKGGKVSKAQISGGNGSDSAAISVPTGTLDLTTSGQGVEEAKRYTTIERMDGYVQLHPQTAAYRITYEANNSAVAHLRKDGKCFRVHGGKTKPEQGILIHEAPHVGWLIGCIGPRHLNDRATYTESSRTAMNEMFDVVGREADLFVLDW